MSKLSKKRKKGQSGSNRSKLSWKGKNKARPTLPVKPDSQLTSDEFSAFRREMSAVIADANYQIDLTLERGEMSIELFRFLEGDRTKRFSIEDIQSPTELRAYMSQIDVIMSTIQPLSKKGMIDAALAEAEVYRGQFGNQHKNTYTDEEGVHNRHFNTLPVFDEHGNVIRRAVNPELAARTFSAYRRLEEQYAGYIGRQGQELMFGSENLIILLYDFYEKNSGADFDFSRSGSTDDALLEFSPILRDWINAQVAQMEGVNSDFSRAHKIIADWDEYLERRWF